MPVQAAYRGQGVELADEGVDDCSSLVLVFFKLSNLVFVILYFATDALEFAVDVLHFAFGGREKPSYSADCAHCDVLIKVFRTS